MLREIFRTEPIPYMKRGSPLEPGYLLGVQYHPNKEPYLETLNWINGMHVGHTLKDVCPAGPSSIYVWTINSANWWPSWSSGYYKFDGKSGKFIRRMAVINSSLGVLMAMNDVNTSRQSIPWATHLYGNILYKISLGKTAQELVGEETEPVDTWGIVPEGEEVNGILGPSAGYPISRFHGQIVSYNIWAMDDKEDLFLHIQARTFSLFKWSTGEFLYETQLPNLGIAICLEDSAHCYILLADATVMLFDYIRNEVLGASKIPPLISGKTYYQANDIKLSYDPVYRRLLVAEETPDNPDTGAATTFIRGFRMVPEPTRLTIPIPLKAPRQRRVIPVLVQAVGDTNEGVGGYVINAQVTGAGSLVGIPITDHNGNGLISVACEGSSLFAGEPDWSVTGSPEGIPEPHTGLVTVVATAKVYQPDPADIPVSGAPGGGGTGGPGAPGGYIWDWHDQVPEAPPPDAPGNPAGAPTDMASWEAYFFGLISRTKGSNANDFNTVLMALVNQGAKVNPAPNEVPQESWPFYGIAIMVSGGEARGRIWLPTATSYVGGGNVWYTHEIQVIADAPATGGGGGGNFGPPQMPNMMYILEQVKNSKPAGYWKFTMGNEYDKYQPDGRGAFMAEAVKRMHDVDARFGHFNKTPPHNGYAYSGGAVDAVCFLNDDGVSVEGADTIGTDIKWQVYDQAARVPDGDYNCWIYPGNPW